MDFILVDSIPQDRYNKSCVFCERNQRNALANYGVSIPCAWKNCKSHIHATCASQASLIELPRTELCSSERTLAALVKGPLVVEGGGGGGGRNSLHEEPNSSCFVFCSSAHREKFLAQHKCTTPTTSSVKKTNIASSASNPSVPLSLQSSLAVSVDATPSRDVGAKSSCPPDSVSPSESAASHLKPLPVSTDAEPALDPDQSVGTSIDKIEHSFASQVDLDSNGDVRPSDCTLVSGDPESQVATETPGSIEVALNHDKGASASPGQRRCVPRRNAALLANQEFSSAKPKAKGIKAVTKSTKGIRPRGRPSKHTRKALLAARKKAKLAARAREISSRKSLASKSSPSISPSCPAPAAKRSRHDGSPPQPHFCSHLQASTCFPNPANAHHQPPPLPLPIRGLCVPQNGDRRTRAEFNTIEDLLEWQWEQGGALLMQQAEGSDVVSLLNCLHQLKMENDSLEAKVLRLQAKREHLRSVNSRLSSSLFTIESMSAAPPSSSNVLALNHNNSPHPANHMDFANREGIEEQNGCVPTAQPYLHETVFGNRPELTGFGAQSMPRPENRSILSLVASSQTTPGPLLLPVGPSNSGAVRAIAGPEATATTVAAAAASTLNPLIVESSLAQAERFVSAAHTRLASPILAAPKTSASAVISTSDCQVTSASLVLLLGGEPPKPPALSATPPPPPLAIQKNGVAIAGEAVKGGSRLSAPTSCSPFSRVSPSLYPRIQPRQRKDQSDQPPKLESRPLAAAPVQSRQMRAIQPAPSPMPLASKAAEVPSRASLLVDSSLPSVPSEYGAGAMSAPLPSSKEPSPCQSVKSGPICNAPTPIPSRLSPTPRTFNKNPLAVLLVMAGLQTWLTVVFRKISEVD
uniref:PHD-type domain-containing protein n=1 Tax=Mesocestoides corti TaxID=53468 RepID=A0A5K3EH05_MESCO